MANTGLDAAFGVAGAANLAKGDLVRSILPTAGGIYVDVWANGNPATSVVRKLTPDGRSDTACGVNGSINVLPAAGAGGPTGASTQLAHDAATGKL